MNIYAIIILITLLIDFVVTVVSNRLNLGALSTEIPEEFKSVFDEESYAKSQEYTRTLTKFGFIANTFNLLVLLLFWFSGGFNWLDQIIRSLGQNELVTGILYILALMLSRSALSLPFSIYSTFVIEERFGFNKTTPVTFVTDLLKGMGLGLILGVPIMALVLSFFMYTGTLSWLYAWAALTVITFMIQFVAPTWIMPLFNTFTPLGEGELRNRIEEYTRKVNFPLKGLFIIDGSKRSGKSNAFFTGFGKNKRVALFDTLLENQTTDELVSILAHEVGHYKKKHIIKGMITGIIHTGILFFLLSLFLTKPGLFDAFYMQEMSVYSGFIFFGMLYSPIEMILSVFLQIQSRKYEYEADAYAVETTRQPEDMVSALTKLSRDNLSNLTPHPFYVFLNYSHPPILQRIRAIRTL